MTITRTLEPELLHRMNAYWRAANYLSVGQIYLYDNPLLKRPLALSDVKPLVVGHWGTTPGQNFIYVHLNRVITKYDLDMFYIAGPGHGGPALVGNTYLEGSYSEIYPDVSQDEAGMKKLFTQFSFPGGISSHVAPTTPGSIHEGGELGYSLSHAFGAAFDNPDLIVACVIGDGEAETGPLATAWQSTKFLNPISDGAVLPILHLNGYKISNPTVLARIEHEELDQFLRGCGWEPRYVEGDDPEVDARTDGHRPGRGDRGHPAPSRRDARTAGDPTRPRWPMIVLRSPKGWTGPKVVDGLQIEGTFRSHQVPLLVDAEHPGHVEQLDSWMRSYKPEELFDEDGRLLADLAALAPTGRAADGGQPAHQRRSAAAGSAHARLPRPRRRRARPGRGRGAGHAGARRVPARRRRAERRAAQLPDLRPGRDPVEPARCGVRGHRPAVGGPHRRRRRVPRPAGRVLDSMLVRAPVPRAGWRGTCSPAGTGCSTATRRSSTSSTRCSTSTPNGSRSPRRCRGGATSRR